VTLTELMIGALVAAVLAVPLLDLARTNGASAGASARETALYAQTLARVGDETARLAAGEEPAPELTTRTSSPGLFRIRVHREGVRVTALVPDRETTLRHALVSR
jgi:hypothetical protein